MPTLLWFRRDLRLHDLPPLLEAAEVDGDVLACYVLDPRLKKSSGPRRLAYLYDALRDLSDSLDGKLLVTRGRPEKRIPVIAKVIGAIRGSRLGRLHAVRPTPRRRRPRGPRRHTDGGDRLAVPGVPGPGHQGRRNAVQGVHAVLQRVASTRLARAGQVGPEDGELDRPGRSARAVWTSPTRGPSSSCRPVRRRPAVSGPRSSRTASTATPTTATGPTSTPPAGCRRI